ITDLKEWWDELNDLYSTVAQAAVMRIEDSIKSLSQLKQNGYDVGSLNWKAPSEFRSFKYVQSGFEFDKKNGQKVLSLSKLADIPISYHREIPDDVIIKEVCIKKERTGEWYASFAVEGKEEPPKPDNPDRCVGIDVGILKYSHDTDGRAVGSLGLEDERERLKREQRLLSRKQHGSNNWEEQRLNVAECHQQVRRKRHDFLHKLSNYYATEYDLVAVEDLDVKPMLESSGNSRNTASAAWDTFTTMLEYKCKREGTHFVEVEPAGTTKECASCGVESDKPLWVREHSCPACGFEMDRDANAAINILSRGFEKLGLGQSEDTTPVETVLPMFTSSDSSDVVDVKHVVETGSPCLKESFERPEVFRDDERASLSRTTAEDGE
ncbi:MAG: transposase, partial [Halobacteria archaeon]|nr:transposase [Halobacteria archaeon]